MFDNIISFVLAMLMLALWGVILIKFIKNKTAPVRTVHAVVVDKFKASPNVRKLGAYTRDRYVIVFQTKEKKLSFYVSEFSYNGYRLKEKGTLKYKGNRIIDFS